MAFVAIPSLIGPLLGPLAGGLIVGYLHWRMIFFVNLPIGVIGLYLVYRHLPDHRAARSDRLDLTGLILFGCGLALLSYVIEVFGEHTLGGGTVLGLLAISLLLLAGYVSHSLAVPHPLLRLGLLRIRTLRTAVVGSFITRLGTGGMPFLLPLLYQVGLGYSPIQSGLLIVPQSCAAMALKLVIPRILARFGYRWTLLANTLAIGLAIMFFATTGPGTPVWIIIGQSFAFGLFSSLQYTCMNTLAYADVDDQQASMASTIASTMQQMSMSFGIATASLVTALFIPDRFHADAPQMIHGMHIAFLALGALTIGSAIVFFGLRNDDGDDVSRHRVGLAAD